MLYGFYHLSQLANMLTKRPKLLTFVDHEHIAAVPANNHPDLSEGVGQANLTLINFASSSDPKPRWDYTQNLFRV